MTVREHYRAEFGTSTFKASKGKTLTYDSFMTQFVLRSEQPHIETEPLNAYLKDNLA